MHGEHLPESVQVYRVADRAEPPSRGLGQSPGVRGAADCFDSRLVRQDALLCYAGQTAPRAVGLPCSAAAL